ncbi:MAG TPA: hypothetical protein ENI23_13385 [bacterium]|nr:hypothetical protein [bacterium]
MSDLKAKSSIVSTYPHLLKEWDFTKNGNLRPEEVTSKSNKKVWWRCNRGHSWCTRVAHRTSGCGCPGCRHLGGPKEKSLAELFPEIAGEWDYEHNDLSPVEVKPQSNRKVSWVCYVCSYKWLTQICQRTKENPTGCPSCAGNVVNDKNKLSIKCPELIKEWDFGKNTVLPSEVAYRSHKRVFWICSEKDCRHEWSSILSSRTRKNSAGCPVCSGRVAGQKNNLEETHSHLLLEWDYEKNKIGPKEVKAGSNKKVWWCCSKESCGYKWEMYVYRRALLGRGCHACANHIVWDKNSLSTLFPEVAVQWSSRNRVGPNKVVPGSGKRVWWKCLKLGCQHEWKTDIYSRTYGDAGCPKCSRGNISRISQEWLDFLGVPKKYREFTIRELRVRVDAFDPQTNTVYEFLGDYWHGNPEIFSAEEINQVNKKTFGELYKETLKRLESLRNAGYNVVHIWEKDFKKNRQLNTMVDNGNI